MIPSLRSASRNAKGLAKRLLNRWPPAKGAAYVVDDLVWWLRMRAGWIGSEAGASHGELSVEECVRHLGQMYALYRDYGGVERFHGAVAEIGPGDTAGVALLMLRDGCTGVDLIDRYESRRDPRHLEAVYEAFARAHRLERLRPDGRWDDKRIAGLRWRLGTSAEQFFAEGAPARYDFIVSRYTMEHLYDPLGALRAMIAGLRPDGRMLHQIDFQDHGMFAPEQHELTFLRFPSTVYRMMTRNSGRPNRVLLHRYRAELDRLARERGLRWRYLVTGLVGVGPLDPFLAPDAIDGARWAEALRSVETERGRFAEEFAGVDGRDLAVTGIFLSVQAGSGMQSQAPATLRQ